jgi:two-component system chemotaxis sensor kinase CheA
VLDQLPKQMMMGEHTLRMSYIGIGRSEIPDRLLVVLSDITEELTRERVERDARELTRVFQRITADRPGFEQFFVEAGGIVRRILTGTEDLIGEKRLIHTLKGNCSVFGIDSVAESCHRVETLLEDEARGTTDSERARLGADWDRVAVLVSGLLGERRSMIELDEDDYEKLLAELRVGIGGPDLIALVERWRLDPVSLRLARLADKARYLAEKLNKGPLSVHVQGGGVRLDGATWTPFWSALVHAVNNAVDHGIETGAERKAQGKSPDGNIWLSAEESSDDVVISLRDDGRGINWDRVKEKAQAAGLPYASRENLVAALFAEGLSTKDTASVMSGRGVGLGAVREATTALGGHIDVASEPNQGATFQFRFPRRSRGHGSVAPSTKAVA